MIFVKYFLEEPASFEGAEPTHPDHEDLRDRAPSSGRKTSTTGVANGPDLHAEDPAVAIARLFGGPRLYRGYLSASDTTVGTSGATSVTDRRAWIGPLITALGDDPWWTASTLEPLGDPEAVLSAATDGLLLVGPTRPATHLLQAAMNAVNGPEGRRSLRELTAFGTVLQVEPSFDGSDWSLLSSEPLAERVRRAFEVAPIEGVRRFVIPLRQARGEHRFHFERYDTELYRSCEVGVSG